MHLVNIRNAWRGYLGIGIAQIKTRLAYSSSIWANILMNTSLMVVMVYFWQAVYAGQAEIKGQSLEETINYILLARMLVGFTNTNLFLLMSHLLYKGLIVIELLRPLDFQTRCFAIVLGRWTVELCFSLPIWLIISKLYGLKLPNEPLAYLYFLLSLLLGMAIIFLFDWILACALFSTLDPWGMKWLRDAIATFLGGAFIPLSFMPIWLRNIAEVFPFSQVIFVPVAFLSGTTPLSAAPKVFLIQVCWLVGLYFLSRLVFTVVIRKVTVQGG